MKLPNQSTSVNRTKFTVWSENQMVYAQQALLRRQTPSLPQGNQFIAAVPGPGPRAAVDHSLIEMLLSGCTCISPNCVALSCPAECVRGGRFVC
jgi:hypothetical protein